MSLFEPVPEDDQDPLFHPPGTLEWSKQDRKQSGWSPVTLAFVALIFIAFAAAALLRLSGLGKDPPTAVCSHNLQQIGLALDTYRAAHGCFPPAYTLDAKGRPMHSWRALLLPYFKKGAISSKVLEGYDFALSWDSPHNQRLLNRAPDIYRCPADTVGAARTTTSYMAVLGADTLWPFEKPRPVAEVPRGLADTIAVVEVAGQDVPWLEPRDLSYEELTLKLNDSGADDPASEHAGVVNALFADGHVAPLNADVSPEELRKLLSVSDDGARTEPVAP